MVTKLTSWKHYVKIDHWEKDEMGNRFMVDINGNKWEGDFIRSNNYEHLPQSHIRKVWPTIKTMNQNRKVMYYTTYAGENISSDWKTCGKTMSYNNALEDFLYMYDAKLAKDSHVTILEMLLE